MNPESQQEQAAQKKCGPQRKYDDEFRRDALEQMKICSSVTQLARQLGIRRKWLYHWRDEASGRVSKPRKAPAEPRPAATVQSGEKKRIAELEHLVARQALEIDFFKGALRRIEEKRRKREQTSGRPSTSKSGQ